MKGRKHTLASFPHALLYFHTLSNLLPLLKEPEKWCLSANIKGVATDSHDVVEEAGDFGKHGAYVLSPGRDFNA